MTACDALTENWVDTTLRPEWISYFLYVLLMSISLGS